MSAEQELEDAFNEWYYKLLLKQETCLIRDVLRDCRNQLKQAWMNRKPIWTSDDIKASKEFAEKIKRGLFTEDPQPERGEK